MSTAEGFSAVAAEMSEHYGTEVSRQQVFQWWTRQTRNKAGRQFPPGSEISGASTNRPGRRFEMSRVYAWADAGIPTSVHERDGGTNRWRYLGNEHTG